MNKILFFLFLLLCSSNTFSQAKTSELIICFYHNDSLKANYRFYFEQDSIVKKMHTEFDMQYQKKLVDLQAYIIQNEERAKQGILSEFDINKIREEAQTREQALISFQETEGLRIEQEGLERLEKIYTQIEKLSKEFCEKKKIDILLTYSKEGQFAYITPRLDVTKDFIAFLNKHTK